MNEDFLAAYIPETFTVLGKRLQPFSIDHGLWLQRLGCDPVNSYDRLITAVLICSRPVDDIRATLDDPWLRLKVWAWGKRLGAFDVGAALRLFADYIDAHSKGPGVFTDEEEKGIPGAPWLQHLRTTLMKHGWHPRYVASMPYGLAIWDYYTIWENEGRLEIVGDNAAWMHEQANQRHDEIVKAAKEGE